MMQTQTTSAPRYAFRYVSPDVVLDDARADKIGHELARLREARNGKLEFSEIVKAAKSKRSSMHSIIWGKTAEEVDRSYREDLARKLVSSVVEIEITIQSVTHQRVVESVMVQRSPETPRVLVTPKEVAETPFMLAQKEAEGIRKLKKWLDEYKVYSCGSLLGPKWRAVKDLLEESN